MDVRAWDLRTGKLAWTFHTIPHPGETGYETWPKDYRMNAGRPPIGGAATVDEKRGHYFLADRSTRCTILRWARGPAKISFRLRSLR